MTKAINKYLSPYNLNTSDFSIRICNETIVALTPLWFMSVLFALSLCAFLAINMYKIIWIIGKILMMLL